MHLCCLFYTWKHLPWLRKCEGSLQIQDKPYHVFFASSFLGDCGSIEKLSCWVSAGIRKLPLKLTLELNPEFHMLMVQVDGRLRSWSPEDVVPCRGRWLYTKRAASRHSLLMLLGNLFYHVVTEHKGSTHPCGACLDSSAFTITGDEHFFYKIPGLWFGSNNRKQMKAIPGAWEGNRLLYYTSEDWGVTGNLWRLGVNAKSFLDSLVVGCFLYPENILKDLKNCCQCQCGQCLLVIFGLYTKTV